MRENIGEVSCPFHKRRPLVPVRRDKNGKLFASFESEVPAVTELAKMF